MTWSIFGWAALVAVVLVGLIEVRRVVLSLNADMSKILAGQADIRRRLDALERRR